MANRGVLRHSRFDAAVEEIAEHVPRIKDAIDGAAWALAKHPDEFGVKNPELDVWQARLSVGPSLPDVLISTELTRDMSIC